VSRPVVIALDRSDLSARALPFALQVAQLWRGRLVLVLALVGQDEHAPVLRSSAQRRGPRIDAASALERLMLLLSAEATLLDGLLHSIHNRDTCLGFLSLKDPM